MSKHKCDGCKYKGEHQEMMFKPFGVCCKETDLIKAEQSYNADKCPYEKQHSFGEWISVTERLPRRDEYVLCYSEYDTIFIGYVSYYSEYDTIFIGYRGFHSGEWQVDGFPCKIDITHWMPLPEPPERSDEE